MVGKPKIFAFPFITNQEATNAATILTSKIRIHVKRKRKNEIEKKESEIA